MALGKGGFLTGGIPPLGDCYLDSMASAADTNSE